jgi:biopolymer transport protein ExbD
VTGPESHAEKAEPNLTPLLDMVLQLVMFFMLCANFVMEQVNETIKLPVAIEAKSLDKTQENYIVLNVTAQGGVLLGRDETQALTAGQLTEHMRNQADLDKARTKPADWEAGRGRSLVIVRGHKECTYKHVHDVMQACRRAGYQDVQLRVIKLAPGQVQ